MKFSSVLFVWVVRSTVPARPVVGSAVAWFDACEYEANKPKAQKACSLPGNLTIPSFWAFGYTGNFELSCDSSPCCAPDAGMDDGHCKCVKYGARYDTGPNAARPTCCSMSTANNLDGVCGCALVGTSLRFGGTASDCCSGAAHDGKCIRRACTVAGEVPADNEHCCRSLKVRSPTPPLLNEKYVANLVHYYYKGKCGCTHAGDAPATETDVVDFQSCCSQLGGGGVCACIDDPSSPLINGAVKSDCCTKDTVETDGKTYCKAAKCLGVGQKPSGGVLCCSGVVKNGMCGCLAPGKKIPVDGAARTCCSGEADPDDKERCGHLHVGDTINKTFMEPGVCSSGKVDKDGACTCIHDGDVSAQPSQCCSGWHSKDKKCGCLTVGNALQHGADASDCCSGTAEGGMCLCSLPGRPSRLDGKDCCSKSAKGGDCGCFGPKDDIVASEGPQCCGGFYNESGTACSCVPADTAVASFVHDGACCGDLGVVGGRCDAAKKK